jgi:predicted alpha/beta hydrolase
MERFEITAPDSHRFEASLHAAPSPSAPLLVFMAALGVRSRYYDRLGAAFAEAGTSFATFDWRGMESSSLRASRRIDWGYRELVEVDLPAALAALRERLPDAPLWLGGHSLGGQLSALHASRHPDAVHGLVLIASGTVHYRAWPTASSRAGILALTQSAPLIAAAVGHYPGAQLRFGGREARRLIGDWSRVARSGRYRPSTSEHDYEATLATLAKPVLALGFAGDHLSPGRATAALLAKLPRCARTQWRWSAEDSGGAALDHFNWAKRPDLIAPTVSGWIRGQGESSGA